ARRPAQQFAAEGIAHSEARSSRDRRGHRGQAPARGGGHCVWVRVGSGRHLLPGQGHHRRLVAASADRRADQADGRSLAGQLG
nr:hypothetical protein [Tanacetum cinerariifolium]